MTAALGWMALKVADRLSPVAKKKGLGHLEPEGSTEPACCAPPSRVKRPKCKRPTIQCIGPAPHSGCLLVLVLIGPAVPSAGGNSIGKSNGYHDKNLQVYHGTVILTVILYLCRITRHLACRPESYVKKPF